jgi:hypothetical protein
MPAWQDDARKAILKPAEREAQGIIGDKVHTDVWGPATVETPQHKKYYCYRTRIFGGMLENS